MLSPFRASQAAYQSQVSKESKPSLTIYAHQISLQTSEIRSLLSSSITNIAEDRGELRMAIKETRDILKGHDAANTNLNKVVKKLEGMVDKQQSTINLLVQTLTTLENNHASLQDSVGAIAMKLNTQNTHLQNLVQKQEIASESIRSLEEHIKSIPAISDQALVPEPTLLAVMGVHPSSNHLLPTSTIPTLPALTGHPPILSDTESSIGMLIDTPAPARKPTKRSKQSQKPRSSQWNATQAGSYHGSSGLRRTTRNRRGRQRSPSLGPVIEGTPSEAGVLENQSLPLQNQPLQQMQQHRTQPLSQPGLQTIPQPFQDGQEPEPLFIPETQSVHRGGKESKRRILASTATQKEWEMEETPV